MTAHSNPSTYDVIGRGYSSHRAPDPRIGARIWAALADAKRVCNVGAGAGSTWVELTIAGTVLVTAVHALRPLFPGRELLLTAAFGLVHGLAFAGRDLGQSQALWTLVGFNTGIELAQLGLLFIVVPWILLLARTCAYAGFRVLAASCAALPALGWLFEVSPTAAALARLDAHPLPLLAAAGSQPTSVART